MLLNISVTLIQYKGSGRHWIEKETCLSHPQYPSVANYDTTL